MAHSLSLNISELLPNLTVSPSSSSSSQTKCVDAAATPTTITLSPWPRGDKRKAEVLVDATESLCDVLERVKSTLALWFPPSTLKPWVVYCSKGNKVDVEGCSVNDLLQFNGKTLYVGNTPHELSNGHDVEEGPTEEDLNANYRRVEAARLAGELGMNAGRVLHDEVCEDYDDLEEDEDGGEGKWDDVDVEWDEEDGEFPPMREIGYRPDDEGEA